ncbi:MAG: GH116 family glycosyl hydrolase, partial [Candidatus Eremiobacteraeota bacterium]|nr:GH116 family glycosyl hydrolase [Candidatus Eremiobacteraeota bacterium]
FVAWNKSKQKYARVLGCSTPIVGYETTSDHAKAISEQRPSPLAGRTDVAGGDPLAVFELSHALKPGKSAKFALVLSFSLSGREAAARVYRSCPPPAEALQRTQDYYGEVLGRSIVLTPDPEVNRGVLWAKANMLRVQLKAPTGWAFTNDPGHSNNSVARDTAWFAYGADYLTPEFSHASLLAYVKRQQKSGMIVEYYDIRNGKAADYGLNINDNTPLLILALWHHYNATGDEDFLRETYPAAVKAARYIVSQCNDQGLVWCTSTGTSDWGIIGWRNVIQDYRLSGATTEVNSECYAALQTASQMARVLDKHEESAEFKSQADALRDAINAHLANPSNGLYYLNITVEGIARSDITADLVFPVMFGVAPSDKAAHIIGRLSEREFWTDAGIRTVPRNAPYYSPGPRPAYGLLGGVWVAMSFWYAFAAAPFVPDFMAHALSTTFRHYSQDPKRNNTVPGQFSEWLHGETLVNEGMMLSPWFPPRYLWAAIEGAAGLDISSGSLSVNPRLAPDWKWCAVQNLPYCGRRLTWFVARTPELQMYANFHSLRESVPHEIFEEDISEKIHPGGEHIVLLGLRHENHMIFLAGNTSERTSACALRVEDELSGSYRARVFDSLLGRWQDRGLLDAAQVRRGIIMRLERKGFWLVDLEQEL